ncbi:MAG: hypothetical protein ACKOE2_16375 [Actinomycetales bacterium]
MVRGPLIPGLQEFDGPKRGVPKIVWVALVLVIIAVLLVLFVGVFRGSGPLRSLGLVTDSLQPVAFRPTTDERIIQVAVSVPNDGICEADPVQVQAAEQAASVAVSASVTSLRNSSCTKIIAPDGEVWVDVVLAAGLQDRAVVKASDGRALPRQSAANLG